MLFSSRSQAKKGKFSLHFKFHATSAHVVLPFPKKEGATYFPSRFGKRNWLVDLYLENFKVTHAAIGNIGNGKTHVLADGIVSYFGMKYESGKKYTSVVFYAITNVTFSFYVFRCSKMVGHSPHCCSTSGKASRAHKEPRAQPCASRIQHTALYRICVRVCASNVQPFICPF